MLNWIAAHDQLSVAQSVQNVASMTISPVLTAPAVENRPPVPQAPQAPREEVEDKQDGFQTVVKSSKGKNLAAAKSVDNLPGASLAADARQAAEALGKSPAIQDTIETWTHKANPV